MKYLKLFKESTEDLQLEDWQEIKDIFITKTTEENWKFNKIFGHISAQERYQKYISEPNVEKFSIHKPGQTRGVDFLPFDLKDLKDELLHLINYLGDRFVCIVLHSKVYKNGEPIGGTYIRKITDINSQNFDNFKTNNEVYYLYVYYKMID